MLLILICLCACSATRPYTLGPIKSFDPDNRDIPLPATLEENQIWDLIYYTGIYQFGKPLDFNWTIGKIKKFLAVGKGDEADNVNALDEVPNSSWFTNRHFHHRLSPQELARGVYITAGPDKSAPWTITRGKFEGGTPGFTIEDARGHQYILKFDAVEYPEMGSSAEVISTKILHACGYNVPQNTIEYFDPSTLIIGPTAQVLVAGVKRKMTRADVQQMLEKIPRRSDGKIRVLASKFVTGKPVGIWNYRGTRKDDPNDLVFHENRRELRGLRVISSWLNDADRRAANTLAVYVKEDGNRYIKHYLIDMGSTLGSNNLFPHGPKYGNEYLTDPRTIFRSMLALGTYVKPWEFQQEHLHPRFPSVGYFESEIFEPRTWVPTYPNPAFEKATLRDAYWGARMVMSFSDEDISAIVESAQMSDSAARQYLIQTLIERRDKIGRYWFSRMNPLDRFELQRNPQGGYSLKFEDLGVSGGLYAAAQSRYRYTLRKSNKEMMGEQEIDAPVIALPSAGNETVTPPRNAADGGGENSVLALRIITLRENQSPSRPVTVYLYFPSDGRTAKIAGIEREE